MHICLELKFSQILNPVLLRTHAPAQLGCYNAWEELPSCGEADGLWFGPGAVQLLFFWWVIAGHLQKSAPRSTNTLHLCFVILFSRCSSSGDQLQILLSLYYCCPIAEGWMDMWRTFILWAFASLVCHFSIAARAVSFCLAICEELAPNHSWLIYYHNT